MLLRIVHCLLLDGNRNFNSYDTRIECINTKYVTDEELVNKHTNLMKELHKELEHQIKQLREENEGNK
mgnify:CR=1 FL=1